MNRRLEIEEQINAVLTRIEELSAFKHMFTMFKDDELNITITNFECSDIEYELSILKELLHDLQADLILIENE